MDEDEGGLGGGCGDVVAASTVAGPEEEAAEAEDGSVARAGAGAASEVGGGSV